MSHNKRNIYTFYEISFWFLLNLVWLSTCMIGQGYWQCSKGDKQPLIGRSHHTTVGQTVCATVALCEHYVRQLHRQFVQQSAVAFTPCNCCTDSWTNCRTYCSNHTATVWQTVCPTVSRSVARIKHVWDVRLKNRLVERTVCQTVAKCEHYVRQFVQLSHSVNAA